MYQCNNCDKRHCAIVEGLDERHKKFGRPMHRSDHRLTAEQLSSVCKSAIEPPPFTQTFFEAVIYKQPAVVMDLLNQFKIRPIETHYGFRFQIK